MVKEKNFKTKSGFCHITSDQLILTRNGVIGNLSKVVVGNKMTNILIKQSVFSIVLFSLAIVYYILDDRITSLFFTFLGALMVYGTVNSLNNSASPIIDRDKIIEIKFKKALPFLTRSRFEVFFENESGEIKKRLIMLPGSLSNGFEETKRAIALFKEEKLL